ncbi:beta/gamma crystallin domain-containing protein [Streptomyces sp. 3214.6]|uniref:beta/gamma crystallin domain-containing protein n=1 Tax=Streptomyces sp. 3214.6 TaxID=1882757 RepID=UPI00090A0C85|nr:beta/gamma crystallin domain-containing protein [Streptomyces sp. 3214.6]SHH36644.1 Beta/Gamma crystallin [Streptomyces sp. 3214.6]
MNPRAKKVVLSALTAVAAAASLTVATTPQASAINQVPCNRPDFLQVQGHSDPVPVNSSWLNCYANAGEAKIDPNTGLRDWVDIIATGNNLVQWHGDGRWQPDAPIAKWVTFTWPNNPGGVRIDKIRIL